MALAGLLGPGAVRVHAGVRVIVGPDPSTRVPATALRWDVQAARVGVAPDSSTDPGIAP